MHFFVLLSGEEFSSFLITAPSVAGVLVLYICTAVLVASYVFAFCWTVTECIGD